MARYIHCEKCNEKLEKSANHYDEVYEYIKGHPKISVVCDTCGNPIPNNDFAFAAILIISKDHPNYHIQHPSVWAHQYLSQ